MLWFLEKLSALREEIIYSYRDGSPASPAIMNGSFPTVGEDQSSVRDVNPPILQELPKIEDLTEVGEVQKDMDGKAPAYKR